MTIRCKKPGVINQYPENGSGAAIGGIGLVFFIGFGILALGAVLMLVMRARRPDFFLGRTLRRDTPALTE